jgi:hypothetical protein
MMGVGALNWSSQIIQLDLVFSGSSLGPYCLRSSSASARRQHVHRRNIEVFVWLDALCVSKGRTHAAAAVAANVCRGVQLKFACISTGTTANASTKRSHFSENRIACQNV